MFRRRLPHGTRLLALVALLAALVVAGCGSDDDGTSGAALDPATLAPADAFVYGEIAVRPTGEAEEGARAALRKMLRVDDPGAEIVRLLDETMTEEDGEVTYSDDIEPWLGERIGAWARLASGESAEDPDWAIAVAVADMDAYEEAEARLRDDGSLRRAGTYKDVAYSLDTENDTYAAMLDDFWVGGSLGGIRAAIDASRGGESLADAARYTDAIDEAPDDALAVAYFDLRELVEQFAATEDADPQIQQALRAPELAEAGPVVGSLTLRADELVAEATGDSSLVGEAIEEDEAEVTVGELPGDAWLALATPPLGPAIRAGLDRGGVLDEAAAELRRGTGLDLRRDLLDVVGGLGVFARGSSLLSVGGGVLMRTTSAAGARRLMAMIGSIVGSSLGPTRPIAPGGARGFQLAVPQLPQAVAVLQQGAEIAAGYPPSSAQDLLEPQQRFDESSDGSAAIATLGDGFEPSFVLIVSPVVDLLRGLDQLQVAELSDAIRYVDAYRSVAVGTKRDDDETTVRAVVSLR